MTSVCDPVQYAAMRVLDEDVSENTTDHTKKARCTMQGAQRDTIRVSCT